MTSVSSGTTDGISYNAHKCSQESKSDLGEQASQSEDKLHWTDLFRWQVIESQLKLPKGTNRKTSMDGHYRWEAQCKASGQVGSSWSKETIETLSFLLLALFFLLYWLYFQEGLLQGWLPGAPNIYPLTIKASRPKYVFLNHWGWGYHLLWSGWAGCLCLWLATPLNQVEGEGRRYTRETRNRASQAKTAACTALADHLCSLSS